MNCAEFHDWLQRRLDGNLGDDPTGSERHQADCADCRALARAAALLQDGLRCLPPVLPPTGLAGRIVGHYQAERRRVVRRRLVVMVGLAAALLLAVSLGMNRPTPQPEGPALAPVPVVEAPVPTPDVPSLQESVGEAGSALVALVSRTADETVGQGRLLLPEVKAPPSVADVSPWHQALEPPSQTLLAAGQGVSEGLEPLASSARRAVNLFLRDLPPMEVKD